MTWMEQYKVNQVKAGTIISYNDYFHIYINDSLGKKRLVEIRGELRGLKLGDVDKAGGLLHIQRTLKYATGRGFFEDTPKTSASKRDIPLTKDMISIIDRQKQVYGEKIVKMDGYIFHLPDGTPISRERLQHEIDRIVKHINADGIKFERFTPHCFRHPYVKSTTKYLYASLA